MKTMENSDRFGNIDMRKELKRQTKRAIKACTVSLMATVILLVGLKLKIGFAMHFVFAGHLIKRVFKFTFRKIISFLTALKQMYKNQEFCNIF